MTIDAIPDPITAAVDAAMEVAPTRLYPPEQGMPRIDRQECERMMRAGIAAYFEHLIDQARHP